MNKFSFPNILSLLRLAAAPLLVAVFWLSQKSGGESGIVAAALFIVAAITDFIDGYWARRHNLQTRIGAFLDPVADKILVTTALLLLLDAGLAAAGACLLIIGREVFVSALREWAALSGINEAVRVSAIGKWKTATQMTAIPCLFLSDWQPAAAMAGAILLWAAAALATWSMAEYCRAIWRTQNDHVEDD